MSMLIPDEVLHAGRLSERELKVEIAIMLFEKEKLTLGQASRFATMDRLDHTEARCAKAKGVD